MYVYVACVVCLYNNSHFCSCVHPSHYEEVSQKAILVTRRLGPQGDKRFIAHPFGVRKQSDLQISSCFLSSFCFFFTYLDSWPFLVY